MLKSDLSKIANAAPGAATKALRQTANDIAQITKQLAPVDTGALQRSYRVEPVSESVMHVGSDVEYAPFVEYGTSDSPSQPHLTPAFHQSEETFEARMRQELLNLASG